MRSSSSARTDREASIEANEFVWDDEGATGSHRYLAPAICERLDSARARAVLDLGCGNGALTAVIAAHGYEMAGCDASTSGIDKARRRLPGATLFLHELGADLPVEHVGRYDAVVSAEVVEHLLLPRKLMRNAFAALKPGGEFIATTPYHGYVKNLLIALTNGFDDHWHPLRDYGHIKFFSRHTFMRLFAETGFSDIRYATAGRVPAVACSMVVSGKKPLTP
jgi:2-polyprenyl-6-hydroxyphenyl methylase/3-demethylubiquinone-9 3-methyltransferase